MKFVDLSKLDDGLISIIREIILIGGDTDISKKTLLEYNYFPRGTNPIDSLMMKNYTHYSVTYRKHNVEEVFNLMAIARHQDEYNV